MYIEINGKQITRFQIFEKKPKLWIWLCINFVFFWFSTQSLLIGFIISFIIYTAIVNLALSNLIERILRRLYDVRHLATNREKERLENLFEEVYAKAMKKSEHLKNHKINLYIQDTVSINAFAIGKNTIVITRGLMETMNDDEIKAILAHEFAHIANGDTQLSLLISIASNIYLWLFMLVRLVINIFKNLQEDENILGSIASFVDWVMGIAVTLATLIANIAIMSYFRETEYIADKYAYSLGYGSEMISALYKFYDMQISDKKHLLDRIQDSHPKVAFRIEALENMENYSYL